MKCPKCGHENSDIRLFCSSCGAELPESDSDSSSAAAHAAPQYERPAPQPVDLQPAPEPEFKPLDSFDIDESASSTDDLWADDATPQAPAAPDLFEENVQKPVISANSAYARPRQEDIPQRPLLTRSAGSDVARSKTHIPKRNESMDPDDFFAVRGQVLPEYNDEETEAPKRRRKRENEYEDSAPQSFAVRHMRGIVTLVLLLLTVLIVLIWANTDNAQLTLARLGIAWKPEAYAELGAQAYAANDLSAAGYYYSGALERDSTNYNYAISAANAYIEGGYIPNALDTLRICIELQPQKVEPYIMLMDLQSGYDNMSEYDRQLVDNGFAITNDSRLNMK